MSARIGSQIAVEAARNLAKRGWRSPQRLAESTWEQRVKALNEAGYTRDQERTATCSATPPATCWTATAATRASRARGRARPIFFREVQVAWDELFPFADRRALDAARPLKLRKDPGQLAGLVKDEDYPRLVAALVRVELDDDYDAIRDAA